MNAPRVTYPDYIDFLVAAPRMVSCTEAARSQPPDTRRAAHDALTRLLHRLDPDSTPLWEEAQDHIDLTRGMLIIDDLTNQPGSTMNGWGTDTGTRTGKRRPRNAGAADTHAMYRGPSTHCRSEREEGNHVARKGKNRAC